VARVRRTGLVGPPNPMPPTGVILLMVKRALGPLAMAIFAFGPALSSASATTPERGFVSGKAVPCSGPMYVPTAHVSVFQGKVLVVSRGFQTGSTFRFPLAPGRYVITNNRAYPTVGTHFRIRAHRLTHIVMTDACD
jgi:hypothetical protein